MLFFSWWSLRVVRAKTSLMLRLADNYLGATGLELLVSWTVLKTVTDLLCSVVGYLTWKS